MSKVETIIDVLEKKVNKILHKKEILKQNNTKLELKLAMQQKLIEQQKVEIFNWTEKYYTLKLANSMLGSNEDKRETKLKINALIRDIDHCIAQLSE